MPATARRLSRMSRLLQRCVAALAKVGPLAVLCSAHAALWERAGRPCDDGGRPLSAIASEQRARFAPPPRTTALATHTNGGEMRPGISQKHRGANLAKRRFLYFCALADLNLWSRTRTPAKRHAAEHTDTTAALLAHALLLLRPPASTPPNDAAQLSGFSAAEASRISLKDGAVGHGQDIRVRRAVVALVCRPLGAGGDGLVRDVHRCDARVQQAISPPPQQDEEAAPCFRVDAGTIPAWARPLPLL